MKRTTEHIVILILALVFFAGGVFALSQDRGTGRTTVLAMVLLAMVSLAVRVTLNRLNNKGKK